MAIFIVTCPAFCVTRAYLSIYCELYIFAIRQKVPRAKPTRKKSSSQTVPKAFIRHVYAHFVTQSQKHETNATTARYEARLQYRL